MQNLNGEVAARLIVAKRPDLSKLVTHDQTLARALEKHLVRVYWDGFSYGKEAGVGLDEDEVEVQTEPFRDAFYRALDDAGDALGDIEELNIKRVRGVDKLLKVLAHVFFCHGVFEGMEPES